MTLIEEADEKLILVSPYCNFSNWNKFTDAFKFVKQKNIDVEFYVRKGESKTIEQVNILGYKAIEIENLHAKLYLNEKSAISGSMNLTEYSDKNSLDLAFITENEKEYLELENFYKRYLFPKKGIATNVLFKDLNEWFSYLDSELREKANSNFDFILEETKLIAQGPNRYYIHISNVKRKNSLNICGILSQTERDVLEKSKHLFEKQSELKINLYNPGNYNEYNTIWHHSDIELTSNSIDNIYPSDYKSISQIIISFISSLEFFKNTYYKTNNSFNNWK